DEDAATGVAVVHVVNAGEAAFVGLALRLGGQIAPAAGESAAGAGGRAVGGGVGQCGGDDRQAFVAGIGQRGGQGVQAVGGEEGRIGVARQEGGVTQHPDQQVAIGDQ